MNDKFPPIIDASKPGALNLGEITIFSLGTNAYIVSAPSNHQAWQAMWQKGFLETFPGSRVIFVYRHDSDPAPSFTALAESANLVALVRKIVVEALAEAMKR